MNRRTLLRVAAGAVGGSAATLVGLEATTDPAAAETALSLDVAGDSATIGADGGVASVTLDCDIEWAYDLPSGASPETVVVEIAAGTSPDAVTVVASAESAQLFPEADGSESFDVGLLAQGAMSASAVEPDGSGTAETSVTVEARLRVGSSDDQVLAKETASDEATLSVTRDGITASEYGSVGGSGTLTISTE